VGEVPRGQAAQWGRCRGGVLEGARIDPKGERANDALAAHHYTLGKALEAQGKDGGADFRPRRRAQARLRARGERAEAASGGSPRPIWMLYAAVVAACSPRRCCARGWCVAGPST